MRILLIGSGGREHALAWALAQSRSRPTLYIAPGNAGTAGLGQNVPIAATATEALLAFAQAQDIDLTVVGPEQPLVEGLVDRFSEAGLHVIGPTAAAAQLEGSKDFAKAFMQRHSIPTARYRTFGAADLEGALAYVRAEGAPIVLKADGLAAGKGVLICTHIAEAEAGLQAIMADRQFGAAGDQVVIEAFMEGQEASVFALTDGTHYVTLAPAQDHKRIGEGDTGPNTGGMGAYAPAPIVTPEVLDVVKTTIIEPTLQGMAAEGHPYRGFLYCGLMLTAEGPKVVEFNCRMGDPETQVVLPLLKTDLVEVLNAMAGNGLGECSIEMHEGAAACVVLASEGYPGAYEKGKPITGIAEAEAQGPATVFHAGTRLGGDGTLETAGGRVLGVTARGADLHTALERAYRAVHTIAFDGKQFRRDIGQKGLPTP